MESLLILILSVVVSGILSSKKKKKTAGHTHPGEKTTLPSSPWDDLIRDLQQGRDNGPSDSDPVVEAAGEKPFDEQTFPAGTPEASFEPVAGSAAETDPQPYFTYDDQVLAELSARQEPEPFVPEYSAENRAAESEKGSRVSESEPSALVGTLFPDGFDPRMAVLYAEVMTPKFRQY